VDSKRPRATGSLDTIFSGKKAKWLPLYHRLAARVTRISGIEVRLTRTTIELGMSDVPRSKLAQIRVVPAGLSLRLALSKAQLKSPRLKTMTTRTVPRMSHQVLLASTSDLDEEFLSWIKAARTQARMQERTSR
jgi:hypothetical protein